MHLRGKRPRLILLHGLLVECFFPTESVIFPWRIGNTSLRSRYSLKTPAKSEGHLCPSDGDFPEQSVRFPCGVGKTHGASSLIWAGLPTPHLDDSALTHFMLLPGTGDSGRLPRANGFSGKSRYPGLVAVYHPGEIRALLVA